MSDSGGKRNGCFRAPMRGSGRSLSYVARQLCARSGHSELDD
jgi:hypothetical protein